LRTRSSRTHDLAARILDLVESFRELASSMLDVYLATISNRMNEIMKVLTIISTIFIPLSFVAGIYGMNFNTARSPWNMPELNWPLGYPFALLIMALVAGGLLLWFWRRGWFSGHASTLAPPRHRSGGESGHMAGDMSGHAGGPAPARGPGNPPGHGGADR
jgi:hypothetical protein